MKKYLPYALGLIATLFLSIGTCYSCVTLNASDLSMGALTIGDSEDKVYKVLGQPNTLRQGIQGRIHLDYEDIEVILYQGKIFTMISQTPKFSTPRGIREGSTLEDAFRKYGNDYKLSYYDNDALYEYFINSVDATPCLLRFAVHDSEVKIYYISIRVNH